jgi:hypothetical protein
LTDALPLMLAADARVLVARTGLPSVSSSKGAYTAVAKDLQSACAPAHAQLLCLVGKDQPYSEAEVANLVGIHNCMSVMLDPVRAQVFSHGAAALSGFGRSAYGRSLWEAARVLQAALERTS